MMEEIARNFVESKYRDKLKDKVKNFKINFIYMLKKFSENEINNYVKEEIENYVDEWKRDMYMKLINIIGIFKIFWRINIFY